MVKIMWGYWDLNPGLGISPALGFSPNPYRHLESPMIGQATPYPRKQIINQSQLMQLLY